MEKITGKLTKLSPRFWSRGWGWGEITDKTGIRQRISGILHEIPLGTNLTLSGRWEDSKYGRSFAFTTATASMPEWSVYSWLEELPHIGPHRRATIQAEFGDGFEDMLHNRPEELLRIDGITEERLDEILTSYLNDKEKFEEVGQLCEAGYPIAAAHRLYLKGYTVDTCKPYILYLKGIVDFSEATTVAMPDDRYDEAVLHHHLSELQAKTQDTVFFIRDLEQAYQALAVTLMDGDGEFIWLTDEEIALPHDVRTAEYIYERIIECTKKK